MVILHLLSQLELTGAEVYMQALAHEQMNEGHEVIVVSDKIHVPLPSYCPVHNLKVSAEGFFERRKVASELKVLIRNHKVDIVHCHSRAAVRIANLALHNTKTPYVSSVHGIQHFSWSKKFIDIYGEYIGFICENAQAHFISNFHVPKTKTRIFRNPMDLTRFSFHSKKQPTQTIGYIARTSGPKGKILENFLEIEAPDFLATHSNHSLEVIASGEVKPEFQQVVDTLKSKFPDRFTFKNSTPDLSIEYPRFDLVIGSGRVAIEAILSGCHVFAIGEAQCLGLITAENWQSALNSNFGDIGGEKVTVPFLVKIPSQAPSPELAEKARSLFSAQDISKQTLNFYRDAIFKKNVPQWIPVLMYHKVPKAPLNSPHKTFVIAERFESHLQFFKNQNFSTLHFKDLKSFWVGKKPFSEFPKKPLLITFDDGYLDTLTEAQPLLKKYALKANLFLLGQTSFKSNSWDGESDLIMDQAQRASLDLSVFEIGAHGLTHASYTKSSESQVLHEMIESKRCLEVEFKQEVMSQAYPYGDTASELSDLSEKAGYLFSVNTDRGGMLLTDDRHQIFRVNIFPEENWFSLWKKTSTWYRKYYFKKRGQ